MTALGPSMHSDTSSRSSGRGLAALLMMSLLATLLGVAVGAIAAPEASAAVPGAAPANPTTPCTWNWNRWSRPGGFSFPYNDNSFDPTQAVFSQVSTALGTNGWYEASSAPQFSYSGHTGGPAEETVGANDSEWTYGVGFYIMQPGTRQTITISDGGRQESHAFGFFDSSGNQFDRYPKMADVGAGTHYIASEQEPKSNPAAARGIARANAWSTSVSFTVPADGLVYIHYLNFDERLRTRFASFSGACGPITVGDTSSDNVPAQSVTIDVAANDSNIDPRSIAIIGADSTGKLVVSGQGTWSVDSTNGAITFSPEPRFVGDPAPIRYTATDRAGKGGVPAQVTVDYSAVFSARDDSLGNPTGETVAVGVTNNDSNVDRATLSIVGANSAGGSLVEPGRGTWTVNRSSGVITFVPLEGVERDPTPISYIVNDVGGNQLPAVAVVVSYGPEVKDDESLQNVPGDIVAVDVVENDLTFDIDPRTVAIVGADPATRELVVVGEGTWSVDPVTNEIAFAPEPSFAGDPDVVRYTVADVDGNVAPSAEVHVDYLPVTRDDTSSGHPAGGIVTIDVLANDPSNDLDPTTVELNDPNYDEVARTLTVPGEGTWSVDAVTGAITVTPQRGFVGQRVSVEYVLVDDDGNVSLPAELAIERLPLPVAAADESLDNEMETSVTIDVLKNDPTESIDPTTVRIVGADPISGVLKVRSEGSWSVNPTTGAITFDPRARYDENPTPISYVATDELGVAVAPTLVTVTYFGVVPETLAFIEPSAIDWWSIAWRALATAVLLIITAAMVVAGRRAPRPVPARARY